MPYTCLAWKTSTPTCPIGCYVIDSFTYGATLGMADKLGNFSFGINYTSSSNIDEFYIQVNARFIF